MHCVAPDDGPGRALGDARGSSFLNSGRGESLEIDDSPGRLLGVENSSEEDLEVDERKARGICVDDRLGRALGVDDRTDLAILDPLDLVRPTTCLLLIDDRITGAQS